jgi:long-chain acyl-CoA synthetase
MHTFGSLAWAAQCGIRRVPLDQHGRMLSYLPLAHMAERTMVQHGQLATGATVFFAHSQDTFVADLQRARPTVFFSVPRLWLKFQQNILAKVPRRKLKLLLSIPVVRTVVRRKILAALGLDACRFAIGGAAPMPPQLLRWYAELGLEIVDVYGMTENGGLSHSTLPGSAAFGTVGWPFDGVQSRIDPATGEIQQRSGGLMRGYFKQPELTAQVFTADGWLRTGDKGVVRTTDGALQIVGRLKELFKTSKGKYVAPAPIEHQLMTHDSIDACIVVGANQPQPIGLVRLHEALAAPADPSARQQLSVSLERHLANVNDHLDPHERLDRLVVVDTPWTVQDGHLTPTLKIRRHQLEDLYAELIHRWSDAPGTVVWQTT